MRPALTGALALLVAPVGLIVVLGGTSSSSTAVAAPLCTASTPAAAVSGSPSPTTNGTTSSAAAASGSLPTLTSEQLSNAAVIARTGATLHIPEPGWVVAIDAALTESDLRNLPAGDADSLGLFQERPSQGWGSPEQVLDPTFAATQFFTHLQAVPHWQTLPVDVAAQDVEQSDHPDRYGPNVAVAQAVLTALTGTVCTATTTSAAGTGVGGLRLPGDTVGERAVNAALSQLGVPYSWGGGSLTGPSRGIDQGADTVGFDCSGLARYAYAQAGGPTLPRTSEDQAAIGPHIPIDHLQAGDLLFFHTDGGTASHVGLYDGHGGMIHAPATGLTVTDEPDVLTNPYWSSAFDFATRPAA